MKEELFARLSGRYLALDIHKHYSIVAGVDFEGHVILEPVRIEHAALEGCLYSKNHQQKTARIIQPPNRFLFLVLFLTSFLLTS